jgi:hypothetical protein
MIELERAPTRGALHLLPAPSPPHHGAPLNQGMPKERKPLQQVQIQMLERLLAAAGDGRATP